jgi:hypothetical protein
MRVRGSESSTIRAPTSRLRIPGRRLLERSDPMNTRFWSFAKLAHLNDGQADTLDVAGAPTGITSPKQSGTTALVAISAITVFAGLASGAVALSPKN